MRIARAMSRWGLPFLFFHPLNDFHSLDAHARDAHEEVNDLLLMIGKPMGVELAPDSRVLGCFFFVLDPILALSGCQACSSKLLAGHPSIASRCRG
jgi:hypothetical protein